MALGGDTESILKRKFTKDVKAKINQSMLKKMERSVKRRESINISIVSMTKDTVQQKKIYEMIKMHRFTLYISGIKLPESQLEILANSNLLKEEDEKKVFSYHLSTNNFYNSKGLGVSNIIANQYATSMRDFAGLSEEELRDKFTAKAAKRIDKVSSYEAEREAQQFVDDNNARAIFYDKEKSGAIRKNISKSDWYIEDKLNYSNEFYEWIESIRRGWQYKSKYDKFDLYREQARYWLSLDSKFPHDGTEEQQIDYARAERSKCLINSLYAVNKYGIIKDSFAMNGKTTIECWEVQEFLLYLFDIDASPMIGKPRQIGSTTVIALAATIRLMLSSNGYYKLVAQKGTKSDEIFKDKIKFPFESISDYMRPTIANYNGNEIVFKYQKNKGGSVTSKSSFEVCDPAPDVVNAGTPDKVLCDEIGLNEIIDQIISQGRPTQFRYNPSKKKLEMVRAIYCWGTSDKTSKEFEVAYNAAKEAWIAKDFRYGMIPIFINCFAKPGMTEEFYESEKRYYYSKQKIAGQSDPKLLFHQTYPVVEKEMFLADEATIVSTQTINRQIDRVINCTKTGDLIKRGKFEPIYDKMEMVRNVSSLSEGETPYKIIGARFIPASQFDIDHNTIDACIHIRHEPDNEWIDRYYSGDDPINTSSGNSNFSTSIFDAVVKGYSAWMDFRSNDYRTVYMQSLLLKLYYSPKFKIDDNGAKQYNKVSMIRGLHEYNAGSEYYNYAKDRGLDAGFIVNSMLPDNLQTQTVDVGVRKHTTNAKVLMTNLEELILSYGDKIDDIMFWQQLSRFVLKVTESGHSTFKPKDKEKDRDDNIDSKLYAYIGYKCYRHKKPSLGGMSRDGVTGKYKVKTKKSSLVLDEGYNLVRR